MITKGELQKATKKQEVDHKTKSAQRWWQKAGWLQEHEAGGKPEKQGGTPSLRKDDKKQAG